ncbi:MAG TPA: RNA polymerase sigma factor [Chthoniobacterales bacterium]
MEPPDPDLALVHDLQAGHDDAYRELMRRHREGVLRFVHRHVANEADAVDLTQEAFVRAYLGIRTFQPRAKFATWLYRIALNLCRDFSRRRAHREAACSVSLGSVPVDQEPATPPSSRPDAQAQAHEGLAALEKAINGLPFDLRGPLVLTALEGHSHAEAAELLQISSKAVEMKVYRARKLLTQKLDKEGY